MRVHIQWYRQVAEIRGVAISFSRVQRGFPEGLLDQAFYARGGAQSIQSPFQGA
jgi:hypothetical protein